MFAVKADNSTGRVASFSVKTIGIPSPPFGSTVSAPLGQTPSLSVA